MRKAYESIATELGCRLLPVGDAFENARRDPDWRDVALDAQFNPKTATPPGLPHETHSLHRGYTWTAAKKLKFDGHHANTAGEYLGAAVWYECMYGHSVVGNTFVPPGLKAGDVAILQRISHQTVSEGLKPAE